MITRLALLAFSLFSFSIRAEPSQYFEMLPPELKELIIEYVAAPHASLTPTIDKAMVAIKALFLTHKASATCLKDSELIKKFLGRICPFFKGESSSPYKNYTYALLALQSKTARSLLYELFTESVQKKDADIATLKILIKVGIESNPDKPSSKVLEQGINMIKDDMLLQEQLFGEN
jgi:hypothetical protein